MTGAPGLKSLGLSIRLGENAALMDPSGALLLEDERVLLVSDLHFEKGSSFALRRVLLPPYDTASTLVRLAVIVSYYAPRAVVALGDSFHDLGAAARLSDSDRARLRALQMGREWIWVLGNHDPCAPTNLEGVAVASMRIAGLTLRHEPAEGQTLEIAGHLHPVARLSARGRSLRRRCFVADGSRCIMPAFGAYTGGLNIRSTAFQPLFGDAGYCAYILGLERVFCTPPHCCLVD
jgi:DNA ligase-associated metallophosphoesterase